MNILSSWYVMENYCILKCQKDILRMACHSTRIHMAQGSLIWPLSTAQGGLGGKTDELDNTMEERAQAWKAPDMPGLNRFVVYRPSSDSL